ncbi:hypothetical protein L2E82_30422 [Cichorium intybus]|uniref:Uncharacterized protein n=1 Tax=Cichorium intybus TaxID=13427 RepID=A0ACB9D0U7_CICIN|nr:hypothetical protein L2E82_30422 [Cichorium intybus]
MTLLACLYYKKISGLNTLLFSLDGLILGTRTSGALVKIWDFKSQENVGAVTAIFFQKWLLFSGISLNKEALEASKVST